MTPRDYLSEMDRQSRVMSRGRVLRDGAAVTAEALMRIADNAACAMQRANLSADDLAKVLGVMPGMLATALRGEFPAVMTAELEACIRGLDKWCGDHFTKAARPEVAGWVRPAILDRANAAFKWASQHDSIVLACAAPEAGLGVVGEALCRECPGSWHVAAVGACSSPRGILKAVAEALRITAPGSTYEIFAVVRDALKGSGRTGFVTGLEKSLVGRQRDAVLGMLADLHEEAGIGMVWGGTSALAEFIRRGQGKGEERISRLASLISWWVDLDTAGGVGGGGDPANGSDGSVYVTVADVQRLLVGRQLRLTPEAIEYLRRLASEPGAGGLRGASALLDFAERLSPGKVVDSDVLRAIQAQRLGAVAAERLESRMGAFVAKAG